MSKKVYVDLSQQDVQDIINAYEKDIEKFNKQKEVLDKIKEEKKQLIEWLESKNKKYLPDYLPATIKIDEVLDYLRKLQN